MDGREVEMGQLLDAEKLDKIENLFLTLQSWELNPVVEHFNGTAKTVSYDEAKLVRAYMRQKGS